MCTKNYFLNNFSGFINYMDSVSNTKELRGEHRRFPRHRAESFGPRVVSYLSRGFLCKSATEGVRRTHGRWIRIEGRRLDLSAHQSAFDKGPWIPIQRSRFTVR
jgi:hypothetical protein